MPDTNDEIERLQRLRDRNLQARDPSTRRGRYQSQYHRQRAARKGLTAGSVLSTFSHKVRGLFVGILLGLLAWILLSILVDAPWVDLAGLGAAVLFSAAGVFIGASFDWRDDLRDF